MLPPHEGPEPGYIVCACVCCVYLLRTLSSVLALPGITSVHPAPHFSHPMASAVTPPRQLAPTVGLTEALAGVFIRTGSILASGERVVCGLVHRFGALNFISDNAGCFGDRPLPRNGCLVNFGAFECYVATEVPCRYPEHVLVAADPPAVCAARGRRITRPVSCAEVMMTRPARPELPRPEQATPATTTPQMPRAQRRPLTLALMPGHPSPLWRRG